MAVKKKATVESVAEVNTVEASSEKSGAGFCVYIGPTIVGVIQTATIYPGEPKEAMQGAALKLALARYPGIAALIVSGDTLAEDRIKVKTPGEALYQAYRDVTKKS